MTFRRHARSPSLALLALLTALLLRAGIPAGYMLAPVDGRPLIVPCSGFAPAMPHSSGHHHHAPGGEVPCAFALVAPPAPPEAPPTLVPPLAMPLAAPPRATETVARPPRILLLPPATGPPTA